MHFLNQIKFLDNIKPLRRLKDVIKCSLKIKEVIKPKLVLSILVLDALLILVFVASAKEVGKSIQYFLMFCCVFIRQIIKLLCNNFLLFNNKLLHINSKVLKVFYFHTFSNIIFTKSLLKTILIFRHG